MAGIYRHAGEKRSSQRPGMQRHQTLQRRAGRITLESQIKRYQRRAMQFSKVIKMEDIEMEGPPEPKELMDLPSEIVTKIVEMAVGAGGKIQLYRGSYSDGIDQVVIATHSWDDMHISTFSALRLVSKQLKRIADHSFFRHGVLEVMDPNELNMAFRRNIGTNFGDEIREVAVDYFRSGGVEGVLQLMAKHLLALPNLRRLIFHAPWEPLSLRGVPPGKFQALCLEAQESILDKALHLIMMLRRKHGKRGIRIEFDADGSGRFSKHEEVIRRDFIVGRSPTAPLSPEEIKVKTREINELFNQAIEAKEREAYERKISRRKEQVDELKM
ncbi:uncharacterized protein BDZ99DRAFT_470816 [Mytilinidion resinicola]|uniref:Uncharacterized protein n=1 Tax=Mytilinidion resinicola TaxID=574789 RepID=A0A6A6Z9R8_9PEZI|nr:uncharacterized protein BDZ99DRAFT_470816 [Mytilinidion resinicola]KAF2817871.1 hypothetical protein BDZ99DRAFT_470816 [Mytilinidion resinicola]